MNNNELKTEIKLLLGNGTKKTTTQLLALISKKDPKIIEGPSFFIDFQSQLSSLLAEGIIEEVNENGKNFWTRKAG